MKSYNVEKNKKDISQISISDIKHKKERKAVMNTAEVMLDVYRDDFTDHLNKTISEQ